MCFSAGASFGASLILSIVGSAAIKKSSNRSETLFAAIPLVFALQQFSEGLLWLGLQYPEYASLRIPATYAFLVFAQVIWPALVPSAIYLLEKNSERKKIIAGISWIGIFVSGYITYCLFKYPVRAQIEGYHILYQLEFPAIFVPYSAVLYFIPTIFSPFLSSLNRIKILGGILFLSFVISKLFYDRYFISVWCYFAALISTMILFIMMELKKSGMKVKIPVAPVNT